MLTYVQQQINAIFRIYRKFVKIYINDIIVFFTNIKKTYKTFHKNFCFFRSNKHRFEIFEFFFEIFVRIFIKIKNR